MENRISYTVIGAFVLILGGLLVAGLLWLAAGGAAARYATYVIYLKSGAASLNRDSPVLYHGVDVGRVSAISLDPANPTRARILLAIRERTPIKTDTRARVETRGVTGAGYISLSGGAIKSPLLMAKSGQLYPVIPTERSGTQSLTTEAQHVAQRIQEISARLDQVLSKKNIQAISDSLQNLRRVTSALASRTKTLDSAMTNLDTTLSNTRRASAKLPALIDQVRATVAGVNGVVGKFGVAADGITKTTTRLRGLSPQAANLIGRLTQASRDLDALLRELQRQPGELLSGKQQQPGPGEKRAGGSGGR